MATDSGVPGFTKAQLWLVLGSLMMAVMLASLETSIIATALPQIIGEFQAFESYSWVGTAYIVTSAISTPILGKLSDIYGRRVIFQITMVVFLIGCIACGAAQSIGQLIAARAFQGMGGGGVQALAFAVLGDVIPPRERGRYIGYFTLSFVGSALLGPLVGGFIIENFSWPWIFYFNIPFILLVIAVCQKSLRLPFKRKEARIDFVGAALLSACIGCLMIGLELGRHGWTDSTVLILFGAAIVTLVMFIAAEQRAQEPMIPLKLFANPIVRGCALLGFCASVSTYGAGTFLSLYFQDSLFVSPTESGLRSLPQMIGVTAATFGIGRLIAVSGKYKRYPIIGSLLSFVGLLSVAQIDGSTKYIMLIVPMVLMGFGTASIFSTTSIASQNAVEFHDLGVTTATVMFFRSLGGSIALAIFGTILNSTIRREIPARTGIAADQASSIIRSPEDIQKLPPVQKQAVVDSIALGVSHIYYLCAAVSLIALVFALTLPEKELRGRAGLSDALENA